MKKIIVFLLIIVFITGCKNEVDYILEVSPEHIKEKIHLILEDTDYDKVNYLNDVFYFSTNNYNNEKEKGIEIIKKIKTNNLKPIFDFDNTYYNKNVEENNITLEHIYNNNYYLSTVFNSCFNNTYYDSTKDYYVIKGYDGFKCLYKDEIKVIIKSKYKIIDSNADKINKNEYIWYFNNDNYLDNELYIQISKHQKSKISGNWKMYVLIAGILIYIILKTITKENVVIFKKNNEI